MSAALRTFTTVALFEGISYILLLGVAMPFKYWLDMPLGVKVVGWAHGILFVAYVALLVTCWITHKWTFGRVVWYFFASLLPFLPFYVERSLKREYALNPKQ